MIFNLKKILYRIKKFPIGGTRGQTIGIVALLLMVFYLSAIILLNMGWFINMRIRVQNAIDGAALSDCNVKVAILNAIVTVNWIRYAGKVGSIIGAIFGADPRETIKSMDVVQSFFGYLDGPISIAVGQLVYRGSVDLDGQPSDPSFAPTSSIHRQIMGVRSWVKFCYLGGDQGYSMAAGENHPDDDETCDWAKEDDEVFSSYQGVYDRHGPMAVYQAIYMGGDAPFGGGLFGLTVPKSIMFTKAVPYGGNLHHIGSYAREKWGVWEWVAKALDAIHAPAGRFFDGSKIVPINTVEGLSMGLIDDLNM